MIAYLDFNRDIQVLFWGWCESGEILSSLYAVSRVFEISTL